MTLRDIVITAAFAAALSGCVTPQQSAFLQDDISWAKQVTTTRDPYRKLTVIQGANLENADATVFLRSTRSDSFPGSDGIVIYVYAKLSDWKFLTSANSLDGTSLRTVVVDRDVRYCGRYGCSLAEHLVLHTDRAFLMRQLQAGLDIRLDGKRGSHNVYLPPNYIAAFLASLPATAPGAKIY